MAATKRKKLPVPVGALDICTRCGKLRGPVKYLPAFKRGVICQCPNSPSADWAARRGND